ncbi:MAG: hypothetical protein IT454_06190 [Planctomycetes bacterium]|nr:hypothetical protein [Planctomycetota bacterium]
MKAQRTIPHGRALIELEALKARFGDGSAARKLQLLEQLARAELASASQVERLHEVACFLRAHPDDQHVLAASERLLEGFARRRDLKRHRDALADTGIAGTAIHYPFFAPTARRLCAQWGERLHVHWRWFEGREKLEGRLALLASYSETPGLDEYDMPLARWIARLKGPRETDAQFIIRRFERIGASEAERDALYEELGLELTLEPGPTTPSRTLARFPRPKVHFQTSALRRERPDIRRELARPPLSIRAVDEREGARWVELARNAMVTRSRDLDAFMHGDARDVRVIDCGEGLEFVCIGVKPDRRLMLESVYAFLTLKNGVPIGYVLTSALFESSEIAYNVFDTWRGGEAGYVYGRVLAMTRAVFGSNAFTIYPYQLGGDGNSEGLKSGAWWFYQKLGFRSRAPAVLALMERELARLARDPGQRSSLSTLKVLAKENVYWYAGRERDDVIGLFPLDRVGLAITDYLAARFGSDRERGEHVCAAEAATRCGVRDWRRWSADERLWWTRWSPLLLLLPGLERWSADERASLVAVVRAKAGRRESDFVRAIDAHSKLRSALRALVRPARGR